MDGTVVSIYGDALLVRLHTERWRNMPAVLRLRPKNRCMRNQSEVGGDGRNGVMKGTARASVRNAAGERIGQATRTGGRWYSEWESDPFEMIGCVMVTLTAGSEWMPAISPVRVRLRQLYTP